MKTFPADAANTRRTSIDTAADDGSSTPANLTDTDLERVAGGTRDAGAGSRYTGGVRRAMEDTEGDGIGLVVVNPGGTAGAPPVVRTRRSGGEG